MTALDYLFIFEIAVAGLVCVGLGWALESAPAVARWFEYRRLRRELRRGRSVKELKAMARVVKL